MDAAFSPLYCLTESPPCGLESGVGRQFDEPLRYVPVGPNRSVRIA